MKNRLFIIACLPLLFLGLFYFYPVARIFILSFSDGNLTTDGAASVFFSTGYYLDILWFTFWQAALSTLLSLFFAIPGAYIFANYDFFGKKILSGIISVPFVLPTVVVATAFNALLGEHGFINLKIERTITLILLAHVFYNYSVVFRIVRSGIEFFGREMEDAALVLGASRIKTFFKITLPVLVPSICASALLVFIFCFSSFGVILLLGGPTFSTLEVEIFRQAVNLFNLPVAAILSLLQIVFTFILMWAYTWIQHKNRVILSGKTIKSSKRLLSAATMKEKLFFYGNIIFLLFFLIPPMAVLVVRSLWFNGKLSLLFYRELFINKASSIFYVPPFEALINSIEVGMVTILIAISTGLFAALFLAKTKNRLARIFDPIFMLPLSTSAVTLGFGFIIALDSPPLNLRSSWILLPIAHSLVAFPFVVRTILPSISSIPACWRESALLLGATPFKSFMVAEFPSIKKALIVGGLFAFTISMGEFGATVFIARPNFPTMPMAIYRFFSLPGELNYGQAMAMSSLLMMVTAAGFLFLEKFGMRKHGEF